MISKKAVANDTYCESYDEIMYKLMVLSGTVEKDTTIFLNLLELEYLFLVKHLV